MKGNTITPRGIIASPYSKPNAFERILMKNRRLFEMPKKLKNKWIAI